MTTLHEAAFRLDAMLIARLREGRPAHVEQVDAVLAEDNVTVVNYIYFSGCPDHDFLLLCYDYTGRPQDFDRHRAAEQLLCDAMATVH